MSRNQLNKVMLFFSLLVITGCATNVYTRHPYPDASKGSGRIIIKLTSPIENRQLDILRCSQICYATR